MATQANGSVKTIAPDLAKLTPAQLLAYAQKLTTQAEKTPAQNLASASFDKGVLHIDMPVSSTGHVSTSGKSSVHAYQRYMPIPGTDYRFSVTVIKVAAK